MPTTKASALQARRFAALGDPTRLQVFTLIARSPLSVAEVAERLPVSRPAVSQHLKVLADAGLVQRESIGTRNLYRPDTDGIATMRDFIDSLWDVGLARFKCACRSPGTQPCRQPLQGEAMSSSSLADRRADRGAQVRHRCGADRARLRGLHRPHRIVVADGVAPHRRGRVRAVVIEPRPGGRWYERGVDGVECLWGQVLLWEPERRVVLVWQLNAQWTFDPSIRTEVDVRFTAIDDRTTRVDLEHRGLEAYGADATAMRDTFDSPNGWNGMLEHYARVAGATLASAQAR